MVRDVPRLARSEMALATSVGPSRAAIVFDVVIVCNRVELLVFEVETNRPQRPAYPILRREPVGVFLADGQSAPAVMGLRPDFPDTPHRQAGAIFSVIVPLVGTLAYRAEEKTVGRGDIRLIEKTTCTMMCNFNSSINKTYLERKYFIASKEVVAGHNSLLLRNVFAARIKINKLTPGESKNWINHESWRLQFRFHACLFEFDNLVFCNPVIPFSCGNSMGQPVSRYYHNLLWL